jgi:hypothetical protein
VIKARNLADMFNKVSGTILDIGPIQFHLAWLPGQVLNIFVDVRTASAENHRKTLTKMYITASS